VGTLISSQRTSGGSGLGVQVLSSEASQEMTPVTGSIPGRGNGSLCKDPECDVHKDP
jgi:hypothetical protein